MIAPRLLSLGALAGALLGLGAPLAAQSGFDDVIPGDALAVLSVDDMAATIEGTLATQSYRMFSDPAFEPFLSELERGMRGLDDQLREQVGVSALEIYGHFEGRVALALLQAGPPRVEGRPPAFAFALLAELREGAGDELLDQLDGLAEQAVEASEGQLVLKFEERAGVEASLLVEIDGGDEVATVSYAVDQDVFVLVQAFGPALEELHLETLLLGLGGELDELLVDNPSFVEGGLSGPGAPGRVRLWSDLGELVRAGLSLDAIAGEPALEAPFGLGDLGTFAMEQSASAEGMMQRAFVSWGPDFGAAPLIDAVRGGGAPTAFEWMPANVQMGVAADLDFGALVDSWLQMISEFDSDSALVVISGMSDFEAEFGFHPRDDVLEALSGQFGVFVKEPEGGVDPNDMFGVMNSVALCVGLDDASLLGEFFDAVIRSQGLHVARKRDIFEGFEVFALPVFPGIELFYSLGGDVLTVSSNGELVRDVLRRQASPELASLASDERLAAARGTLPGGASLLFAMEASSTLEGLFDTPGEIVATARAGGLTFDEVPWADDSMPLDELIEMLVELMPEREIVERYVQGYSLLNLSLTDDGLTLHSYTP